jgi:predicted PurR-regulated permease PerM
MLRLQHRRAALDPSMNRRSDPASARALDRNAFLLLVVVLTVAFVWIVLPYYGAVLWGSALALLFEPLYARFLRRWKGRRNLAALATLAIILFVVILPLALVGASLVQEVTGLYRRVKSGQVNFGTYFAQILAALPSWASGLLERLGLDELASFQAKLIAAITQRGEALAGRAVDIGSDVLDLVVGFCIAMYLLFFLLRDGAALTRDIRAAIPLAPAAKERLLERFTTVIRATVKGNVLVAAAQGALGGLAFWVLGIHAPMLWAVVMAFLSLLPAVGAALIWVPVALYLLAIGEVWQGFALIAFGVFVISLIDNLLRPILIGKDTQLPDYVVLISTVGGLAVIGLNGFVVGPLIVAMFVSAWQLLAAERARLPDEAS